MTKFFFYSLFFLSPIYAYSDEYEFVASTKGGIGYKEDFQIEIDYGWFMTNNWTLTSGIRVQCVRDALARGIVDGEFKWATEDDKMYNLLFPITTEYFIPLYRKEESSFAFFLEPGIILQLFPQDYFSIEYESYKGSESKTWTKTYTGRNFHWAYCFGSLQTGFSYNTGNDFAISLGYELNNQDIYKKRRGTELHNIRFGDQMPAEKNLYHHLFIELMIFL